MPHKDVNEENPEIPKKYLLLLVVGVLVAALIWFLTLKGKGI